jgi:hypothetical protein
LKRQAARFRIYQYPDAGSGTWPTGEGPEIVIGSVIDGKTVQDVIWTVHVANTYVLVYWFLGVLQQLV